MRVTDDQLGKILWDYNKLVMPVEKSDLVMVMGSNDARVAQRGAELYLQGYAPLVVCTGGFGALTKGMYLGSEAEAFAELMINKGVPKEIILIEKESKNTGENIMFTRELLDERGIRSRKIILVQKPYMLRRAYATFKKQWPEMDFVVTCPDISFEDYPNETISRELLINIMVGDTQRIKLYPDKGFQISQEIPDEVWVAYEDLVRRGYTRHLID